MQAVILAAGKSTRTFPLTVTRPKPLLTLANKTLLEHKLDSLLTLVDEVIIVVGYRKEMIEKAIGGNYHGILVRYVEQTEQKGTGHALLLAKKHIRGKFIAMYGDDWYGKDDIKALTKYNHAIGVAQVAHPERFGVVEHENMMLRHIVEKPKNPPSNLISTGIFMLDESIFTHLESLGESERGDIEFPEALASLSKHHPVHCLLATEYFSIGYPWDLLRADMSIRKGQNSIRKTSAVTGHVHDSSIGENCRIKGTVKHSIIMDNAIIEEGSLIEHSVIGHNVTFQGSIKSAKATSVVGGNPTDAGLFGAAIGDHVSALGVDIDPGCKIWPSKTIKGSVHEDIK
jgi:UDP-N-acetylglucosamine diphosphorylase / glucose-1-phosphate thymidylyltransferase / UDP-N-acetylgalactosamine diphosphorylase / glucosamine-1-phosphate N-acetyltransferase / galactosamine-1-phosphate N-acetyltransferase